MDMWFHRSIVMRLRRGSWLERGFRGRALMLLLLGLLAKVIKVGRICYGECNRTLECLLGLAGSAAMLPLSIIHSVFAKSLNLAAIGIVV